MRRAVLWDTSAILAILDRQDQNHERAQLTLKQIIAEKRSLFMTNYIQVEAHAMLLQRLGRGAALAWLMQAKLPVLHAEYQEEDAALALLTQHADKDWSLCDAISFAVMTARGVGAAFAFDRHFVQYARVPVLGRQ